MVKICWYVMITTHTSTRKRTVRQSSQVGHTRKSFPEAAPRNFLKDESTTRAAAPQRTTVIEIVKNNDASDEECTGHEVEPAQRTLVGSQTYQDECSENDLVKVYRREFVIQASLYVLAYIAPIFFFLFSAINHIIVKRHVIGRVLVLLASIFYPLGGLFNILVYTRPKVSSLRRMNPQYYWFQAFVIVIRAGAVVPMVVVEEGNIPPARESSAGQSSLSSGGMMLRNLSSIDTPPVILGNALSSGDYSEEPDDCDRIVERKKDTYYTRKFVGLSDSSPSRSPLANALSPATDESSNSTSAGEGERSYLSLFSGMDAIAEESDEEE